MVILSRRKEKSENNHMGNIAQALRGIALDLSGVGASAGFCAVTTNAHPAADGHFLLKYAAVISGAMTSGFGWNVLCHGGSKIGYGHGLQPDTSRTGNSGVEESLAAKQGIPHPLDIFHLYGTGGLHGC